VTTPTKPEIPSPDLALLPVTYLITFSCYGSHLHGAGAYSVDRKHNVPGWPCRDAEPALERWETLSMIDAPYELDADRRSLVLDGVQAACQYHRWRLLAAHVRTTHAHIVLSADGVRPDKVMNVLKAWASRDLNTLGIDGGRRRRWSRHGSTRYLWDDEQVGAAVRYTVEGQGKPMAVFVSAERSGEQTPGVLRRVRN
jgi:hypothetical protein